MSPFILLSHIAARPARRLGSLARACDGGTAVEFALVILTFMTFVIGIIDFGSYYLYESTLQQTVEAAARCASINLCGSQSAVQSYAASQMANLNISSSVFTLTSATCGEQVSASTPFTFPILFTFTLTLSARSCYPNTPSSSS